MDWFLYDNGLRHERVKGCLRYKTIFCYKGDYDHTEFTLLIIERVMIFISGIFVKIHNLILSLPPISERIKLKLPI